jgi:uncharacterized protein YdaU (DUF1376 family)
MPLYIGDYLKDTGHLCAAEHGAYLMLIMHYWQTGSLPTEDRHLAMIARMEAKEWKKYKATIAAFFDDKWRHKRIDEELRGAAGSYERRARAGKEGGIAKAKLAAERGKANGEYVAKR